MIKLILSVFLFSSLLGSAQVKSKILYNDSNIEIEVTLQECERKDKGTHIEYYYLKVTNISDNKLAISFKREMWYNSKCISCENESPEYVFTDTFLSKETKQGDCYQNTARQYRVFSKMLNFESKSILTDFKISNIKIEKL